MSHYPKYIGICGAKGSGKDTVAQLIIEIEASYRRIAFGDVLKKMALAIDPLIEIADEASETLLELVKVEHPSTRVYWCERLTTIVGDIGWDNAKAIPDVRRFLQRLGTEGGRNVIDPDIWVKATWSRSVYPYIDPGSELHDPDAKFVVTDVRFPNEIVAVQRNGGELWRINRSSVEDGDPHPSERAWRDYDGFACTITNDGTITELAQKVERLLSA
jgi:hypothetical protein